VKRGKQTPSGIVSVAAPEFEIVNGPLTPEAAMRLRDWCALKTKSDTQAAQKIGISAHTLLRARTGKPVYGRTRIKILEFLKTLPAVKE